MMLSTADKRVIREEVTRQLSILKSQLNEEISKAFADMTKKITLDIDQKLSQKTEEAVANTMSRQLALVASDRRNELAVEREVTQKLIQATGQQICKNVYGKVVDDINKKIVPKVNNMVDFVTYKMNDGEEVINNFRRGIHERNSQPGVQISENVGLFFNEND